MNSFFLKLQIYIKKTLAKLPLFDYLTKVFYIKLSKTMYSYKYKASLVTDNSFLFECFKGKMVNDSPLAIYRELLLNGKFSKCTWVLSTSSHPLYLELKKNKNTAVVIYGSEEYFLAYATHQYWIVNCRVPYRVVKKVNQIFVQCWHGTPLKKIGLDIEVGNNSLVSQKGASYLYQKESEMIDHFLSPSQYASKCFKSSFALTDDKILQLGYPRNDQLIKYRTDEDYKNKIKLDLNLSLSAKIVLYAPTYRDNSFCNKRRSHVLHNQLDSDVFMSYFSDDIIFLYRGHYFSCKNEEGSKFIDVSDYDNVNDLLLIANVLVTDYSSLFFDYSILNKPTLFYMYDKQEYTRETRGFYLNVDTALPGAISTLPSTLANDILQALLIPRCLQAFNVQYNPYEDGLSAQRVLNRITK